MKYLVVETDGTIVCHGLAPDEATAVAQAAEGQVVLTTDDSAPFVNDSTMRVDMERLRVVYVDGSGDVSGFAPLSVPIS